MTIIKKFVSVITSFAIMFVSVHFASAEQVTPVILVSGFGATTLARDGEAVFPPSIETVLDAVGLNAELTPEKIMDELEVWIQDEGYVVQLAAIVSRMIEHIRVDENGESYYDVEPIVSGAENTSLAAFKANDMLDYVPYTGSEFLDMESIGNRIGDENVFNFTYDWRVDYDIVADEFKEYIDDVLELTGAEKVSVYSVSQGALVVGQYLYKYSGEKKTDKVVFDTPVLGGTTFVSDLLVPGRTELDFKLVLTLLSDILHTETELDADFLVDFLQDEWFMGAVDIGKNDCILPVVKTCIAFWQLVPINDFERLYPAFLDEEANAAVIEAVKSFHNGFMGNITKTFEKATADGSTISIKACTGFDLVTTSHAYSDSIVDMAYSCGAICAPYGEVFSEDYVQAVDNGKNSISPDRTVDISAGYWPHRTWIVDGLFHGQVEWCKKSLGLVEELLFTNNIKDAYSSYDYPQFMTSESPTSDVAVSFVSTNNCFLFLDETTDSYELKVKNLSLKDSIIVKSVSCSNPTVKIEEANIKLLPGEEAFLSVNADDVCNGKIKVCYSLMTDPFENLEKDFGITVTDTYSGAVNNSQIHEAVGLPFIIRYIISVIMNLFSWVKI